MAELRIEPRGSASVYVLHEGYVGRDGDDERVAGTVTLILDGDADPPGSIFSSATARPYRPARGS